MEQWQDQSIVLSVRPYGENGGIVSVLTEEHGRHAGFVRGLQGSRLRGVLQPGAEVTVNWSSRTADQLGFFTIEQERALSPDILMDRARLDALLSACALCDIAVPEREAHPPLYYGTRALIEALSGEAWAATYIVWEIAFLRELGFALDLTRCGGGGDPATLTWVSPKSGRAVSAAAGEGYRDRLLPLPDFLKPGGSDDSPAEIAKGLVLTRHFLEHRLFADTHGGIPAARLSFERRFTLED